LNSPTNSPSPQRRARFSRVRGYLYTWLLAAFALAAAFLFDFTKKVVAHEPHDGGLLAALAGGVLLSLPSLPILFLLRIVPENSRSSGVRLVRRLVCGILCGLLLGGLLAAVSAAIGKADQGTAQMLAPVGVVFGLIAGLVDSIALDDLAVPRDDDRGDADAGGPSS
jgi:MFS family permease